MLAVFRRRHGRTLRHKVIGNDVAVTADTMGHSISSGKSEVKLAVLQDPGLMAFLFASGYAKAARIRHLKGGRQDGNKDNWLSCWHVEGNTDIHVPGKGTRRYHYDFTVYRRADNGRCELYDLQLAQE